MIAASKLEKYMDDFLVKEGKTISLKDYDTDYDHKDLTREEGEELLKTGIAKLSQLQDKFYAYNRYSLLIIFQAMDAAGKDGAIKHVMSGLNPQGVKVTSFKVPSSLELDHDFLWRHQIALPGRGEIGIFNRSHYENVLVTRIHPEFILGENIPGVNSLSDIDDKFWESRFREINNFERSLAENGTVILKFYLHLSKKEQKKRFLERIDKPEKNWKFSIGDLKERSFWKDYRKAYEDAMSNTSKSHAPWFIIPADDKWFARLVIAGIIDQSLEKLNLSYPPVSEKQKAELKQAREQLENENGKDAEKPGAEQG